MRRRDFLTTLAGAGAIGTWKAREARAGESCVCAMLAVQTPQGADLFKEVGSRIRVTNMKVFGLSLTPDSDRPYVFVKLETDAGVVGWGEATLEAKLGQ